MDLVLLVDVDVKKGHLVPLCRNEEYVELPSALAAHGRYAKLLGFGAASNEAASVMEAVDTKRKREDFKFSDMVIEKDGRSCLGTS